MSRDRLAQGSLLTRGEAGDERCIVTCFIAAMRAGLAR
jgi:hypothetical protein